MDSKIANLDQFNTKSNVAEAELPPYIRTARSVSHGRTSLASGTRSKIPMNINHSRPPSSITKAQVGARTQDDSASSITPGNATRRLTRSHNSSSSKTKVQCVAPGGMQKRWLESQFKKEKKRYLAMKKELDEKQKFAQQVYNDMTQLRDKLISDGGKDPGGIEEIRAAFSNADKQSGDQNVCPIDRPSTIVINNMINQEFITKIGSKLQNYSDECVSLCKDAMEQLGGVLKWMNALEISDEKLSKAMNQHVDTYGKTTGILERRLGNSKKLAEEFNTTIMQTLTIIWAEIETSRWRIKDLESMGDDTINKMHFQLNTAIEKFNQLEEMKTMVDHELMKSKSEVQALQMRVEAKEENIVQLQSQIKNLECQLKQNGINFEHTTRDLHKSLKHSEETIVCLEIQRDDLLSRLNEMRKHLEQKKNSNEETSQKTQLMTKYIAENNVESEENTEKKKEEWETLVKTLRDQIASNEDLIVEIRDEEMQLKEQLAKEQLQSTKLKENYDQLKKEHEYVQQKLGARHSPLVSSYRENCDPEHIEENLCTIGFVQSSETLREELLDSKCKNKDLETQLQQQLKNLEMKNRMIGYLKGGKLEKTSFTSQEEKENNSEEILQELCSVLETKQMQLTHLENVLQQMECQEIRNQEQRTRYEKRIAQLEFDAQMRKNKDCRYVKEFSVSHSSSRKNEIVETLELERKYQRLKRESWQMENIYKKLMNSTITPVKSQTPMQNSCRSNRIKEYICRSPREVRRVNVGCHAHQIIEQCSREFSGDVKPTRRHKDACENHVPHQMVKQMLLPKKKFVGFDHQ